MKMNLTRTLVLGTQLIGEFFSKNSAVTGFITSTRKGNVFNSTLAGTNNAGPMTSNIATAQLKKRPIKKKKITNNLGYRISAFSTAEEYNLEKLAVGFASSNTYEIKDFNSDYGNLIDAVYAVKNGNKDADKKHLFFFREGSVVMWNLNDSEIKDVLKFVKDFEENSYTEEIVHSESETMSYSYSSERTKTGIISDSVIFSENVDLSLEKYTISNAMALSVHLGTFEATLQHYIDTMEPVTEDLKSGRIIKMSRDEVLQKTGQLFALRHNINLNSDLLDIPDFYWDREDLENLYQITANYFCIGKRTKVMNEKINHCIELVQLLSSHLNDKHHIRLEWMIIILIMVEVVFEVIHFVG